jgi:lysyl-tRNA synthetase class 2
MTEQHENDPFDPVRCEKAETLSAGGVACYPYGFERTATVAELRERFDEVGHEPAGERLRLAGRLYTVRNHGKTVFADLGDETGRVQLYIRKNDIGDEAFARFVGQVDRGDIVGVTGRPFRTKVGELSLWVDDLVLLCKALIDLPEKFHGLRDTEKRYRQRYLDLVMNERVRETFRTRSRIVSAIRAYLCERGFLEFETPTLQPIYGGANARPFTTLHNYLDQTLFLRIAPELYLKRLVVGGFERVFEVSKNFRNEDIDSSHNPEFTMVEAYEAYRDYREMMDLTEDLISTLVCEIHGSTSLAYGETSLDFARPWRRMTMEEAVREYAGIDVLTLPLDVLARLAIEHGIPDCAKATNQREHLILFFEFFVEERLIQPTFIHDFPVENSPLAKRHREKEGFTERFELFINGMEIANGFSELNDPRDQLDRLRAQDRRRLEGDLEAQMVDMDFITALGLGMPPTGGVGIGIDRLVMLLTGQESIKEVILFPSMRTVRETGTPPSVDE